jgi:hypothetical protein
MWHTLFGTFRWMPILGVLIGMAGGYFFWQEQQRIAIVDGQGVETVAALIQIRQQTSSQNNSTSYWADIRWRDRTGAERRAVKITVTGTFARRVMQDGRLVLRETRIKYLQGRPEVRPLLLEDGAHNNWKTPAMMWGSLAFAAFCAFGWVRMLRFERGRWRRRFRARWSHSLPGSSSGRATGVSRDAIHRKYRSEPGDEANRLGIKLRATTNTNVVDGLVLVVSVRNN